MMNVFRHALNVFFTFSAFQKVLSFLIFFRRFSSTARIACSAWNARFSASDSLSRFLALYKFVSLYVCMLLLRVWWCCVVRGLHIRPHKNAWTNRTAVGQEARLAWTEGTKIAHWRHRMNTMKSIFATSALQVVATINVACCYLFHGL